MATAEEIAEFVEDFIQSVLDAPRLLVDDSDKLVTLLFGLDVVRRYIRGETNPSLGYLNRREQLGIPVEMTLGELVRNQHSAEGKVIQSEDDLMRAVCEFWQMNFLE